MLTLVLGDLHIPNRATDIPPKFQKLLSPSPTYPKNPKIAQVLCLGNITNDLSTLRMMFEISTNLQLVRGEFDDVNLLSQQLHLLQQEHRSESTEIEDIPHYKIVKVDKFKIGFTNGYLTVPKNDPNSLGSLARELDVDILVFGGSHKVDAFVLDGKFFVNPGSVTGAFNFDWENDDEGEDESRDENKTEEEVGTEEKEIVSKQIESKQIESKQIESSNTEDTQLNKTLESTTIDDSVIDSNVSDLSPEELNNHKNIPSFCVLEINDAICTVYIYTYVDNDVKVDKVTYQK